MKDSTEGHVLHRPVSNPAPIRFDVRRQRCLVEVPMKQFGLGEYEVHCVLRRTAMLPRRAYPEVAVRLRVSQLSAGGFLEISYAQTGKSSRMSVAACFCNKPPLATEHEHYGSMRQPGG